MNQYLTYRQKRFIIEFILYGLPYTCLMWIMNRDEFTFADFCIYFFFYGVMMAFFMGLLEKRSLQKIGLNYEESTMNEHQERLLSTPLSKEEFYDFWSRSEVYQAIQNDDGSIDVKRRYYTSEFKETINITYVKEPSPMMVFRSKPKKWFGNNIALIHKTIDSVKNHAESNVHIHLSI